MWCCSSCLLKWRSSICLWTDNQFFLACIARRTAVVSKSQVSPSIAQFDTKQDLHGRILIVDTGYACKLRIFTRDVKRVRIRICYIRNLNPTCTKTGMGTEAWLAHNCLRTRRDVFVLCRRLPPTISPVHWDGRHQRCWCLITPPHPTPLSTVAVATHSLPPLMLLQSAFVLADRYHALCNEANSSWHV